MWSLSLSHQPSRQQCTCVTPVLPVLPVLLLQRCPVWGRACRYYPGDDLSISLLFSEGAASLKSLYFCTDVVFSTPMPHHPGQAAAAQQGDLCQLEPGDKGDPGGGHSRSIPLTPGVLSFWGAGSQAASLTFIPGSSQMRWERVAPASWHPRATSSG